MWERLWTMDALVSSVGEITERRSGGAATGLGLHTNTWQTLVGFFMWIQLFSVSMAQLDPDGDHICKDLNTGVYRCCDGFYPRGETCVECSAGWYGSECRQKCDCYNGAKCNGVTGVCACTEFWEGPQCTRCRVVPHMAYCRVTCLNCYNADICEPPRGDCQCSVGWHGDYCDQPCQGASYGNDCGNWCNPGWQGPNCSEPCPSGYYGNGCVQCPACVHGVCDQVSGCLCDPGYIGETCEKMCPEYSYGGNCLYQCACVNDGECDPVSGNCTCKESYSGTYCQFLSESSLFEKEVRSLHVLMYVLVGVLNVVLVVSLILYRQEVKLRLSSLVNRFKRTPLATEDDQMEFDGVEVRTRMVPTGHEELQVQVQEYHDADDNTEETALQEYHDDDVVNLNETSTTQYARLKEDD